MRSDDAFSDFRNWSITTVCVAPDRPGAYAFRLTGNPIGRILGKSDLVYIGCTKKSTRTLRMRLGEHLSGQKDSLGLGPKLRRIQQQVGGVEVAWMVCETAEEAAERESDLLAKYKRDHIELPPLNDQLPGRERQAAMSFLSEYCGIPMERMPDFVRFVKAQADQGQFTASHC